MMCAYQRAMLAFVALAAAVQSAPAQQDTYAWLEHQEDDSPEVRRLRSKIQLLAASTESIAAGKKQWPWSTPTSEGGLVEAAGNAAEEEHNFGAQNTAAGSSAKATAGGTAGGDVLQLPQPGSFQGGVSDWIRTVVLPNLRKTTEAMQAEVDKAERTVKECSGTLFNEERQVEHAEQILQSDEGEKFRCLAMEHKAAKIEKGACDDFENYAKFVTENAPPILTNRTAALVGEHINEHYHFADKHFAEIEDKQGVCDKAITDMDAEHAKCEVDEATIEAFFCHMKAGREASCVEYGECYNGTLASYEKVIAKIKVLDGHVVDHFKNVACYQSGIGSEKEQNDCDSVMIDRSEEQLEVSYPSSPIREECIHIMKTRRDYANITCNGGVVAQTPVPEPQPTQEPASNATAGSSGPATPTQPPATLAPAPATEAPVPAPTPQAATNTSAP